MTLNHLLGQEKQRHSILPSDANEDVAEPLLMSTRETFMNVNKNGLQQGANSWLHSKTRPE